jgi:hypothetical protein
MDQALSDWGIEKKLAGFQIQAHWPEIVGPVLASHSQPQRIAGSTLWVVTRAPIWSQELLLSQGRIVQVLLQRFPRLRVRQVRCKVGTLRLLSEPETTKTPDLSRIEISEASLAKVQATVARVKDPDLRASLLKALVQKERRDHWLRSQGALACKHCGNLQELRLCLSCRAAARRSRRRKVFQWLGRQPWSTFQEAAEALPRLRQGDFHTARRQLLSRLRQDYYVQRGTLQEGEALPPQLRNLMVEICMLATATPWDQLQERHALYALGKTWGRAYLDNRAPAPFLKKEFPKRPYGR